MVRLMFETILNYLLNAAVTDAPLMVVLMGTLGVAYRELKKEINTLKAKINNGLTETVNETREHVAFIRGQLSKEK